MAIRSVSLRLIFSEKMAIICPPELPRRENGIVRYLAPNRSSRLVPCHRAHENLFSIKADGQIHSGMTDDHFKYSRNGSYSSIYFYFYHLTQYPRCSTSQHSPKPCFQRTLTLGEVADLPGSRRQPREVSASRGVRRQRGLRPAAWGCADTSSLPAVFAFLREAQRRGRSGGVADLGWPAGRPVLGRKGVRGASAVTREGRPTSRS